MITLKQVAEMAGVSKATASLALNRGPVNEETRKRVIACARQLDYVPNAAGRTLITGRTKVLQFVILAKGRSAASARRTAPFHYCLEGFLAHCSHNGFTVRFDIVDETSPDIFTYFERLAGGGAVEGVALLPQAVGSWAGRVPEFLAPVVKRRLPLVQLCPERFAGGLNFIDMGNFEGGMLAAELLATSGSRKIGMINGPELQCDSIERERGFMHGLAAAGLKVSARFDGDYTLGSGFAGMTQFLAQGGVDGVFCANDHMAAGAMNCIHKAGLRVPEDISVIGYDNNDIGEALLPALTSIDNHFYDLGTALCEGLLALISGTQTEIHHTIQPALVARASHGSTPCKTLCAINPAVQCVSTQL